MKSFPLRAIVLSSATLLATPHLSAATLVNYVNGSNAGSGAPVATATAPGTTNSAISGVSNGGALGSGGNAIRSDYGSTTAPEIEAVFGAGKSFAMVSAAGRDASDVIAPAAGSLTTDYFAFTVTAVTGATVTLDSLGFNLAVFSNVGATTSDFALQLYASVNGGGYAAIGSTVVIPSTSYNVGNATSLPPQLFDLTSLNALGPINTVTFRVWQGSTLNTDSTLALAYQDINVQGTVLGVPEPTALLLGSLGFLGFSARRRRA